MAVPALTLRVLDAAPDMPHNMKSLNNRAPWTCDMTADFFRSAQSSRQRVRAGEACRTLFAAAALAWGAAPAAAIVDGVEVRPGEPPSAWTVLVESAGGRICSGAVVHNTLVLTAAHCTLGGARLTVAFDVGGAQPSASLTVVEVIRHPSFKPDQQPRFQTGVDLALLRTGSDFPPHATPIEIDPNDVALNAPLHIFGFGAAEEGDISSARILRRATLEHVGVYRHSSGATAQFAQDPETKAQRAGRGACGGDSGGPVVFGPPHKGGLVGILSWSTGPASSRCGAYSAFVPLSAHAQWVQDTATAMLKGQSPR